MKTNAVSVTVHTLGGDPVHPEVLDELMRVADQLAKHQRRNGVAMEVTKPIFKLDLEPGDILHVTLGGEVGNDQVWIPTDEDLRHMKQA